MTNIQLFKCFVPVDISNTHAGKKARESTQYKQNLNSPVSNKLENVNESSS